MQVKTSSSLFRIPFPVPRSLFPVPKRMPLQSLTFLGDNKSTRLQVYKLVLLLIHSLSNDRKCVLEESGIVHRMKHFLESAHRYGECQFIFWHERSCRRVEHTEETSASFLFVFLDSKGDYGGTA